jgi:dynein heavy chain
VREHPPEGVFVHGVFLEGARWSAEDGCLAEPTAMELFVQMPVILFKPVEVKKRGALAPGLAGVPLYLYANRTGSRERPSWVITVALRSGAEEPAHWTKRATALLLALSF